MTSFHRIVVATDLGVPSARAVDLAVGLALDQEAELTLVHVFEIPAWSYAPFAYYGNGDIMAEVERAADDALAKELQRIRTLIPRATRVFCRGMAAAEILVSAKAAKADLVIVGTHGRVGLDHLLLGSVAEKVVRTSPFPVLTVRTSE